MADMQNASEYVSNAINSLFIYNKKESSIGCLLGVVFKSIVDLFTPTLKKIKYIDITKVPYISYIILGVVLANILCLFKKEKFSPEVEQCFSTIKKCKKAGVPQSHITLMYRQMFNLALNAAADKTSIDVKDSDTPIKN